jgi:hypothetical protein
MHRVSGPQAIQSTLPDSDSVSALRCAERAMRIACAGLLSFVSLAGCGSDNSKDSTGSISANIVLYDENNYTSTSNLNLGTVETAPAADLDICWTNVTKDLQCHDVDPQSGLDNVSVIRLLSSSEAAVEQMLIGGTLVMSDVDKYNDLHLDHQSTCAKLASLNYLGSPMNIQQDYVESTNYTYVLIASKGTTPGVGSNTMTFLKPTASSTNTTVDMPTGCGILDFQANLHSATTVPVSAAGPWVVDWSHITHDAENNDVIFDTIDNLLIGFFQGMTVSQVETQMFDLETLASTLWQITLTGKRTANLALAQDRTTGELFPGFLRTDGVWAVGLRCTTCQNPAPLVLAILDPSGST